MIGGWGVGGGGGNAKDQQWKQKGTEITKRNNFLNVKRCPGNAVMFGQDVNEKANESFSFAKQALNYSQALQQLPDDDDDDDDDGEDDDDDEGGDDGLQCCCR